MGEVHLAPPEGIRLHQLLVVRAQTGQICVTVDRIGGEHGIHIVRGLRLVQRDQCLQYCFDIVRSHRSGPASGQISPPAEAADAGLPDRPSL